jgi:hypothetical protein
MITPGIQAEKQSGRQDGRVMISMAIFSLLHTQNQHPNRPVCDHKYVASA